MTIPIQPAPALLVGLGARILLDLINHNEEPSVKDHVLIGLWEGIALHYAFKNTIFGLPISVLVAGKLLFDYNLFPDLPRCAITILAIALGFLGTDLISQFIRPPSSSSRHSSSSDRRRRKNSHSTPQHHHQHTQPQPKRQRLVQFRASVQGGSESDRIPKYHPVSDITSVDSNSDLIHAKENMTPLEREIAALRARASLADSERRRFKEERRWAISEGNMERATQLKQQVKRYTTLMQGFHREADAKMISTVLQQQQQTNGNASNDPGPSTRPNTAPVPERQPRIRKSSLTNHGQPSPIPSAMKQHDSARRNGMVPVPILRDPSR